MPRVSQSKVTAKFADKAHKGGQITAKQMDGLKDGNISTKDLDVAKNVLARARRSLTEARADGAGRRDLKKAEKNVDLAKGLYESVKAQRQEQEGGRVSRPSTGSGKGTSRPSAPAPRPSTSSGKGASRPSAPAPRPSTSSGKGASRPSAPAPRPSTSSGKGASRPAAPAPAPRPSTGSGKGVSAPAPAVTRPSTSSGKGHA